MTLATSPGTVTSGEQYFCAGLATQRFVEILVAGATRQGLTAFEGLDVGPGPAAFWATTTTR